MKITEKQLRKIIRESLEELVSVNDIARQKKQFALGDDDPEQLLYQLVENYIGQMSPEQRMIVDAIDKSSKKRIRKGVCGCEYSMWAPLSESVSCAEDYTYDFGSDIVAVGYGVIQYSNDNEYGEFSILGYDQSCGEEDEIHPNQQQAQEIISCIEQ